MSHSEHLITALWGSLSTKWDNNVEKEAAVCWQVFLYIPPEKGLCSQILCVFLRSFSSSLLLLEVNIISKVLCRFELSTVVHTARIWWSGITRTGCNHKRLHASETGGERLTGWFYVSLSCESPFFRPTAFLNWELEPGSLKEEMMGMNMLPQP